jgi:hypothetical protein
LRDPVSKTLHKNRAGGVVQGEGPEFKPQYCKKKSILINFLLHQGHSVFMFVLEFYFWKAAMLTTIPPTQAGVLFLKHW